MQESTYSPLPEPQRFPDDAPNILVVLINDAGPALPECLGSDPYTPTLQNVKDGGVGNGQICEFANDWDGYLGRIPESCALQADVLRNYGYSTGAWGEWHNTPTSQTTAADPFENWPTGCRIWCANHSGLATENASRGISHQ